MTNITTIVIILQTKGLQTSSQVRNLVNSFSARGPDHEDFFAHVRNTEIYATFVLKSV
jgi:hypothetical protein